MKTFLTGLACGTLLTISAITYLEFSKESTGVFTDYIQPLLAQLNEVISTESNVRPGTVNVAAIAGEEAKVLRVIDGDTIDVEIMGAATLGYLRLKSQWIRNGRLMLSMPQSARIVVSIMLDKDKAKEFADRIADINLQVQTGDVNFEQASG